MSETIYLLTIGLPLAVILIIFAMKYFAAAAAARARAANDELYRALAEKAIAVQSESQAALAAMQAELARTSASLAAVVKLLRQVE